MATVPPPKDHLVPHVSKIPANYGDTVQLFVREYNGAPNPAEREPVLMLHGRSVPALVGFDPHITGEGLANRYSWAQYLAKEKYDVFIMDLQGSGRSPRPKMDEPSNANPAQQRALLVPNPLAAEHDPLYPFQLGNARSEWAEVETVVRFIQDEIGQAKKIRFVGWSAASFVMGPYALQHPGEVESLLLLAPMFPPRGRWSKQTALPFDPPPNVNLPVNSPAPVFGFPMHLTSKIGFAASTGGNPVLWEPGIGDKLWQVVMENDATGSKWGPDTSPGVPAGVMRYRNTYWWGWNAQTVPHENPAGEHVLGEQVPVFIVYGELDRTANTASTSPDDLYFSVPALYAAIGGTEKLMFCLEGSGHNPVWERPTAEALHHMSKQWFKNGKVQGRSSGSYFREIDGNITGIP
ncbi:alpha/beta hydrolase [Streptomyces sp. uw30]|uniref:alpha/beta hydrolase n=1 Tax=Streptomyces sp. uw30 TaxID=1828179 RepID=UPI0011CEC66D|nr:alpha/beta hydrolase [Streptomyces sp. uw30]TXS48602.1 alpha/beta hydrolase [Streptomyces sp. uw30]